MMRLYTLACLLLLGGCMSTPLRTQMEPSAQPLDSWVDSELIPYLTRSLTGHPRLRHQPVILVQMEQGAIQPRIDGLTRDLRLRINDALVGIPGVRLARGPGKRHHRKLVGARCGDPLDNGIFLAIESSRRPDGQRRIALRVLMPGKAIGSAAWG